jgi:hypothetical protein
MNEKIVIKLFLADSREEKIKILFDRFLEIAEKVDQMVNEEIGMFEDLFDDETDENSAKYATTACLFSQFSSVLHNIFGFEDSEGSKVFSKIFQIDDENEFFESGSFLIFKILDEKETERINNALFVQFGIDFLNNELIKKITSKLKN